MAVAQLHFNTTRAASAQPHTIAGQLTFLRRTALGPATFTVTELKLGQRTSTLQITLTQPPSPSPSPSIPAGSGSSGGGGGSSSDAPSNTNNNNNLAALKPSTSAPPLVVGTFTNSNINTETGITLTLSWTLFPPSSFPSSSPSPPPLSPTSLTHLFPADTDPHWRRYHNPWTRFRKAVQHVETWLPRHPPSPSPSPSSSEATGEATGTDTGTGTGSLDQWIRLTNGQRFTQATLGYVADMFPLIIEMSANSAELDREMRRLGLVDDDTTATAVTTTNAGAGEALPPSGLVDGQTKTNELTLWTTAMRKTHWARFWYPTVALNMDIKRALPPQGVEWLFARVQSKQVRRGRMDIEVVVLDEGGKLVMLSHHVALIVGAERNIQRNKGGSGDKRDREGGQRKEGGKL